MKSFYIETFGCQMNVHDTEKVVGILLAQGYSRVLEPGQADLVLYNTCTVRQHAEDKVFSRVGADGQRLERPRVIDLRRAGIEVARAVPWP